MEGNVAVRAIFGPGCHVMGIPGLDIQEDSSGLVVRMSLPWKRHPGRIFRTSHPDESSLEESSGRIFHLHPYISSSLAES